MSDKVSASHILLMYAGSMRSTATRSKEEAQEQIAALKADIDGGADFAELAKTYSDGPSKTKGGDLGYFKRGQMVKPFEDAAFSLDVNQVSDIVETRFGYHLIKVFDKRPARNLPYEEVAPKINTYLAKEKENQAKIRKLH